MTSGRRSQLNMSEETFNFVCTSCIKKNKTVEAVNYCVECSGYCCQLCTDVHTVFPALEFHTFLEVCQGNEASGQPSSVPEFPTERCSKHKGKVLDMYCEGHDVVGCPTCFFEDHKHCQDSHIHSIPDTIDTIYKLSDCQQKHSNLKGLMVSMETLSISKDTQLQALSKTKNEALDNVTAFQKTLEAIVRKAADASRQQVEATYKELENEILKEKHKAENICEGLKTTDEKLNQSEGNRAQHFVCIKNANENMKEAEVKKMKEALHQYTNTNISFIPEQSLVKYLETLQGIGQVQKRETPKDDLYKIKGSTDISIKLSDDSMSICSSFGCCITHDDRLLVTDENNKKLKCIDIQKMSVVDYCYLDCTPYGVCCVSNHEVAVACRRDNKIQIVSIQNKMTPTSQIKMSHRCYGIAFNDGKFYVTDYHDSLYVYDMTGTRLETISRDNSGNKLFTASRHVTFNESATKLFVGGSSNVVVCFDKAAKYMSTITDTGLSHADGVCVDGRGNVFVVGYGTKNVVQFSENGKKVGVVVKKGKGLVEPVSVCFHKGLNRMFVTMLNSDVVTAYDIE